MEGKSLAEIGSLYRTKLALFTTTQNTKFEKIVEANPKRIYLKFTSLDGENLNYMICPGQVNLGTLPAALQVTITQEKKFADAPSSVISDWYAAGATTIRILVEEVELL